MTVPCRERVVLALQAALEGNAGIPGLAVERDRDTPVTDGDLPRLVIYEGAESGAADFTGEDGYALAINIEGYAGGGDAAAAASAAATLRAEADRAVLADVTLGGTARGVSLAEEPAPVRLGLEAVRPAKGFVRSFTVEYATAEGDPFTFA
ncbi:MAG: hypothetical protein HY521_13075 [Proteobacteria bacterium]|nr:hypothetical protein [Pseudomonadota bacterium]